VGLRPGSVRQNGKIARAHFRAQPVLAAARPAGIYAASPLVLWRMVVAVAVKTRTDLSSPAPWPVGTAGWYGRGFAKSGYPLPSRSAWSRLTASTLASSRPLPLAMRAVHGVTGLSLLDRCARRLSRFGLGFAVVLWLLVRSLLAQGSDRATAVVCFFPGIFVFELTTRNLSAVPKCPCACTHCSAAGGG